MEEIANITEKKKTKTKKTSKVVWQEAGGRKRNIKGSI